MLTNITRVKKNAFVSIPLSEGNGTGHFYNRPAKLLAITTQREILSALVNQSQ